MRPLLQRAQTEIFGGHMAYATASAMSVLDTGQLRYLPTQWAGAYLLSLVCAEALDLTIDASSVVLLTRPDKIYTTGFNLDGLQAFFRHSRYGRHFMLGQVSARAPSGGLSRVQQPSAAAASSSSSQQEQQQPAAAAAALTLAGAEREH